MTINRLYLDCEFNGNRGEFISLALYNPNGNKDFYEVDNWIIGSQGLELATDFVKKSVMPMLLKEPTHNALIKSKLVEYLSSFDTQITVYADWPEDFIHFCAFLFTLPSGSNKIPFKVINNIRMELITTGDKHISKVPHNALEDAKALYLNHKLQGFEGAPPYVNATA